MSYEFELKNIDEELKNDVIKFLEEDGYNESYIAHFLSNLDKESNPKQYLKVKYPNVFE